MNKNIFTACELPARDLVYLKRDKFSSGGWMTVHPWRDRNGKWLWKNIFLGGTQNLFWVIFVVLLFLGFVYIYHHDLGEMQKVVEDPCYYCENESTVTKFSYDTPGINIDIGGGG